MLQAKLRRISRAQCRTAFFLSITPVDLAWSSLACKVVSPQKHHFRHVSDQRRQCWAST